MLWAGATGAMLILGFLVARKRAPEIKHIEQADTEMQMILYLAESEAPTVHLYFRRSEESGAAASKATRPISLSIPPGSAASPPDSPIISASPSPRVSLYHRMVGLLKVVEYELADRRVVVHFGWPLSSWWDRMAMGVMVFNLMRLPRTVPDVWV